MKTMWSLLALACMVALSPVISADDSDGNADSKKETVWGPQERVVTSTEEEVIAPDEQAPVDEEIPAEDID